MKVSIVGTGYVGLSLATLLSRKVSVVAIDIVKEKVDQINNRLSPIKDDDIQRVFDCEKINLLATTNIDEIAGSDFVIIATPTNYDPQSKYFDTKSVESVINQISIISPKSTIVIKSTIPIGFTEAQYLKNPNLQILFSPEFLREGKALYDNLNPSRIIVGVPYGSGYEERASDFANLLANCSDKIDVEKLVMGASEAESVKLFSNTYLAMRVSFFNELDIFADCKKLSTKDIIKGVCLDPRIGEWYNNPSFGYGGYCLPKDTKQLREDYDGIPQCLINAIVESNDVRKAYIVDSITKMVPLGHVIGIYRLVMKEGSDNFRESSIIRILNELKDKYTIIIFEPTLSSNYYEFKVEPTFSTFVNSCDLILANRMSSELAQYAEKVYCRDIYHKD